MEKTYQIGSKEYTREELYMIGREHYPKLYIIPITLGIIFLCVGILIELLIGAIIIIFANIPDLDIPMWPFFIPLGFFGIFIIAGILMIVIAACGRSKEKYIRYGYNYILKATNNGQNQQVVVQTNKQRVDDETLARYQRLLKGGVITQEEYDRKVNGN